jgi:hypothetical protein
MAGFRNAPMAAATAAQMPSPAAGHAEFIPPELAAAEGAQHRFHLAAEMWCDAHAAPFQRPQQRFGKRGAEQHGHVQFRHAPRQSLGRERTENEFAPRHFLSAPAGDQKQPRRRVEHGRNAFLRDGYGNRHAWLKRNERASHRNQRSCRPGASLMTARPNDSSACALRYGIRGELNGAGHNRGVSPWKGSCGMAVCHATFRS